MASATEGRFSDLSPPAPSGHPLIAAAAAVVVVVVVVVVAAPMSMSVSPVYIIMSSTAGSP
jgi:hypothetical protein